jgi:hypothetical protein
MVAAPLRDHEIDKNKKPDLLQNESCGRLDREQAGLLCESPTPRRMMKAFEEKRPGPGSAEILRPVRTSKLTWVLPSVDFSVSGASAMSR